MSSLIGLLTTILLVALVYTWYRCHKRLHAKGYGRALISIVFSVLLFVCLAFMGSTQNEAMKVVPLALWIATALALALGIPARKGAVKDGRVVQVGERHAGKRRARGATIWGWVFTIGGGLMTLFFTWQLISPTIVPRDEGWQALFAALAVMVLVGQYFFAIGNSTIITTDANWPPDFITPVADWFKEGKKSGRCAPIKCRSCGAPTHVAEEAAASGGECSTCREKEEHAQKAFFDRHPRSHPLARRLVAARSSLFLNTRAGAALRGHNDRKERPWETRAARKTRKRASSSSRRNRISRLGRSRPRPGHRPVASNGSALISAVGFPSRRDEPGGVGRGRGLDAGAIRSRIPGTDLNRFTLFVVSSSRDLVGRALLEMKHECDA